MPPCSSGARPDRLLRLVLLAVLFLPRAWRSDQPILENYVGRQVPTAMVARNLSRGSGILYPQLDTGPFPNLFLVEPPIAAQFAVWYARGAEIPLDRAGRLVSALATTLAGWGLYGLMVRRRGRLAAVGAVLAFAAFPVTLRYGRAFQPDALALGFLVAGLNCWDSPGRLRAIAGALLLGGGLAQKVTWSPSLLLPLLVISASWPRRLKLETGVCLLPALAWYLWATSALLSKESGSAASLDNASIWIARLACPNFADSHRLLAVGRDLMVRSFTPVGIFLALVIPFLKNPIDRLWTAWMLGGGSDAVPPVWEAASRLLLAHLSSPRGRWCGGRGRRRLPPGRDGVGRVTLGVLVVLGLFQSRSTWVSARRRVG